MPHPAPSSESEFTTAKAYYVQTPPGEKESTARERERERGRRRGRERRDEKRQAVFAVAPLPAH